MKKVIASILVFLGIIVALVLLLKNNNKIGSIRDKILTSVKKQISSEKQEKKTGNGGKAKLEEKWETLKASTYIYANQDEFEKFNNVVDTGISYIIDSKTVCAPKINGMVRIAQALNKYGRDKYRALAHYPVYHQSYVDPATKEMVHQFQWKYSTDENKFWEEYARVEPVFLQNLIKILKFEETKNEASKELDEIYQGDFVTEFVQKMDEKIEREFDFHISKVNNDEKTVFSLTYNPSSKVTISKIQAMSTETNKLEPILFMSIRYSEPLKFRAT